MSEKLYAFLFRLYPGNFRRTYGDEALRLVRDRARDEKGFISGVRLWLDLLVDLVISLPREYSNAPTAPMPAPQTVNGDASFQLMAERSLSPAVLLMGTMLSAVLFWACVTSVARSPTFPELFDDSHSLQALVQSTLALARSRPIDSVGAYSFCMTARRDIPYNSVQPLMTFTFASPGASGVALIDGRSVMMFRNEQHVSVHANVFAGDHRFDLQLDRPAANTWVFTNNDFQYCSPK